MQKAKYMTSYSRKASFGGVGALLVSAMLTLTATAAPSDTPKPPQGSPPPARDTSKALPPAAAENSSTPDATGLTELDKISYAMGVQAGKGAKRAYPNVELDKFMEGLKDYMEGKDLQLTEDEIRKSLENMQKVLIESMQKEQRKVSDQNLAEQKAFLDENAKKPGVVVLPDGLQYKIIAQGAGPSPREIDRVRMNYRGTFIDGAEFDSSYSHKKPSEFQVNKLAIKGWAEAIQHMNAGARWIVYIPSGLAYGERGRPGMSPDQGIGPNKLLIMELELLDILPPPEKKAPPAGS